ncbi:hypothetical protein AMTRI_Chr05g63110 [Amborella trichopoda]
MVLMDMMMMLFFLEFYLNLGCHMTYTPKSSRYFPLKTQLSEVSYAVMLNWYLRGQTIRSDSRILPPVLVHGSRPSCSKYHKLSQRKTV